MGHMYRFKHNVMKRTSWEDGAPGVKVEEQGDFIVITRQLVEGTLKRARVHVSALDHIIDDMDGQGASTATRRRKSAEPASE